jgi:hypothetical protein
VPLDALGVEQNSSRNAIYKTLVDARRKLRASLIANGYLTSSRRGFCERLEDARSPPADRPARRGMR